MQGIIGAVRSVVSTSNICIDSNIFRIHYKATTGFLVLCSLLVTAKQYLGDPIDCIVDGIPQDVMDTYCWIHSTFTIPNALTRKLGEFIPHPGIATPQEGEEIRYHKYYQWVCFTLIFQALCFYIPHYLWKIWEGGKVKMLCLEMTGPVLDVDAQKDRIGLLNDYFTYNMRANDYYFKRFLLCEALNFVNVIVQIFFTDLFLGYEFTQYGSRVFEYARMEQEDRPDPMAHIFPKVTKCTFHKYGASGTVQRIDGLCVLTLNIINEKIYVAVWLWFIIVAVITGLSMVYRICTIAMPTLRKLILRSKARLADSDAVSVVADRLNLGDWFLITRMGMNMDSLLFKEFIESLSRKLEGKSMKA